MTPTKVSPKAYWQWVSPRLGGAQPDPVATCGLARYFLFIFFSVLNHYFSTGFNFLTNSCFDSNLGNSDREARTECRIPSFSSLSTTFSTFHLPILWSFVLSSFWLWHGREPYFISMGTGDLSLFLRKWDIFWVIFLNVWKIEEFSFQKIPRNY